MAETVFKKVDYTLKDLVGYIQIGEIGLPDIQRPFVWKNAKVRDLFDSMYVVIQWVTCCSGKMRSRKTPRRSAKKTNRSRPPPDC